MPVSLLNESSVLLVLMSLTIVYLNTSTTMNVGALAYI